MNSKKKKINTIIKSVLKYAKSLEGIKYTWWTGADLDRDDLFYYDSPPKSYKELKKQGTNCTGFINLLMHYSKKKCLNLKQK